MNSDPICSAVKPKSEAFAAIDSNVALDSDPVILKDLVRRSKFLADVSADTPSFVINAVEVAMFSLNDSDSRLNPFIVFATELKAALESCKVTPAFIVVEATAVISD